MLKQDQKNLAEMLKKFGLNLREIYQTGNANEIAIVLDGDIGFEDNCDDGENGSLTLFSTLPKSEES